MKGNIQKVRSLKTPEFWLKVRLKVKSADGKAHGKFK